MVVWRGVGAVVLVRALNIRGLTPGWGQMQPLCCHLDQYCREQHLAVEVQVYCVIAYRQQSLAGLDAHVTLLAAPNMFLALCYCNNMLHLYFHRIIPTTLVKRFVY